MERQRCPCAKEGGLWVIALLSPESKAEVRGLPGPQYGPSHRVRATSPAGPHPVSPAEVGAPRSAGCGPRQARGLGCSAALVRLSWQPRGSRAAPASGERFLPPLLCTSPRESVVGDAHPSASHLQPGARRRGRITGWAGGLGTTRSGGHAGVGAAPQPTAAAR